MDVNLKQYWKWDDFQYNDVTKRYRDESRFYHNLNHLEYMLEAPFSFNNNDLRTLFVFYHDYYCEPKYRENEKLSAVVAYIDMIVFGFSKTEANLIRSAIELSNHKTKIDDQFIGELLDSDLFILASNEEEYDLYVSNVRKEYSHISDDRWKNGRVEFLQSMLALPRIFNSSLYEEYEEKARQNILREMRNLE